ncbi:Metal chaperone involved in Zn homeostasis [Pararobbsia alpina]|uniref:CobW family GTP-binding protein n=1 Tax=Pararobbsia alpina TaxID=621374 RepID=UPI0039A72C5D
MSLAYDVLPVTLVTGFLGSGKSTLLSDMLQGEAARDTAVLVNEFGEVGLDHLLIGAIDTQTILLDNGCVCCSIRGELKDALASLFSRRARGEVPPFGRVVIETTGLATPAPILATVLADPLVRCHFRLDATVAVVDAVNAQAQRKHHPEWLAQVTAADQIVISKTDLVDDADAARVGETLSSVNPAAIQWVRCGRSRLRAWQDQEDREGQPLLDALLRPSNPIEVISRAGHVVAGWLTPGKSVFDAAQAQAQDVHGADSGADETAPRRSPLMHRVDVPASAANIHAFTIEIDAPLDWSIFTLWFTLLLNRHGDKILRVKGLLSVAGSERPAVIHAVQHLVHPVLHLDAWPDTLPATQRRSQLVFITEGLERDAVEASYRRCAAHLENDAH